MLQPPTGGLGPSERWQKRTRSCLLLNGLRSSLCSVHSVKKTGPGTAMSGNHACFSPSKTSTRDCMSGLALAMMSKKPSESGPGKSLTSTAGLSRQASGNGSVGRQSPIAAPATWLSALGEWSAPGSSALGMAHWEATAGPICHGGSAIQPPARLKSVNRTGGLCGGARHSPPLHSSPWVHLSPSSQGWPSKVHSTAQLRVTGLQTPVLLGRWRALLSVF